MTGRSVIQHAKLVMTVCSYSENEDLNHGAVLTRTIEEGSGTTHPQEGDLVGLWTALLS